MLYNAFYDFIRCETTRSAHTVLAYRRDIEQFRRFLTAELCHPDDNPRNVSVADMRLWVASLSSQGMASTTIVRKMSALRSFYGYLVRHHGLMTNPTARLVSPKTKRPLPAFIRPQETEGVLRSMNAFSDDFTEARDALIIDMLYSTGMRESELISLKNSAVDTRKGELKVLGKRNKERMIPFGKELADMITLYRTIRPATPAAELFVLEDGRPLAYRNLLGIVKENLAGRVTVARRTPHVLRHSFATDMLNGGAEITAVQQLLGHASLATTQIYTHLSYRELQHNYQQAHPRAQKKG